MCRSHAGGSASALSKLPSSKTSNKYDDDYEAPDRSTRRTSGGFAGAAQSSFFMRITPHLSMMVAPVAKKHQQQSHDACQCLLQAAFLVHRPCHTACHGTVFPVLFASCLCCVLLAARGLETHMRCMMWQHGMCHQKHRQCFAELPTHARFFSVLATLARTSCLMVCCATQMMQCKQPRLA